MRRGRDTVSVITRCAIAVSMLVALGCRRGGASASTPVNDPARAPTGVISPSGGPRDPNMGAIARRVPGFAGTYYDGKGDINVLLTARGDEAVARRELEPRMRAEVGARYGPERAASVRFLVRRAAFEYLQLEDWKVELLRGSGKLPATSGIGIDHRENRVTVWVATAPAARRDDHAGRRLASQRGRSAATRLVPHAHAADPVDEIVERLRRQVRADAL